MLNKIEVIFYNKPFFNKMPSSVKPMQSDIFDPNRGKCAYCYSTADAVPIITKQTIPHPKWPQVITKYIYNCKAHASDAIRDYRAHLHTTGSVLEADILCDPLFTVITTKTQIVVERSNRSYFDKDGWTLNYSPMPTGNTEFVQKDPTRSNILTISVVKREKDHILVKNISVSDLKLSIPDTDHALVDAFIKRFDEGFYKADYEPLS